MRIALIGAGRIGAVHARSVAASPDTELVLVADPVDGAAERLASAYGAAATTDVGDVFADDAVDAVVVGSPTAYHVEQIVAAVEAGKAVLVEKPVDLDLGRADRCLAQVGDRADRVMLGFNRRFDAALAEIHRRAGAGEIGDIEQLTIISRDPAPPPVEYLAASGGIFRDMTIHDLDMARFFLGDIVAVQTVPQRLDPAFAKTDDFDAAVVTLTAASGAVATIINSRHCAAGYDQRLEAFGPRGALRVENHTATSVVLDAAGSSGARGPYLDFFLARYADAYASELAAFVAAVRDGAAPSPSLLDGRQALALADAATESARTGRSVAPAPVPAPSAVV
ncbi:myo-inositol 2-dehydrogenase [Promicromonospora sp. AC04]|uniref:inositol 2-dehydrogenase n=1 Tax=Promicromonospora sp. AC04 TaxID=2135723 RepID=UPI000D3A6BB3|nr:inositol 2-dehydrogenase [Promicromonospora sp. AC04]PUB24789.1 myo-inositol 2-dehydrogenase [Promicromonospora sp. AC04]